MKSIKNKLLCTTTGCIRPRQKSRTKCAVCMEQVNEMNYIRQHGIGKNKHQDDNPAAMGNPSMPMESIMTCRFYGCEWKGKRRDYLKDHTIIADGAVVVVQAHYKVHK